MAEGGLLITTGATPGRTVGSSGVGPYDRTLSQLRALGARVAASLLAPRIKLAQDRQTSEQRKDGIPMEVHLVRVSLSASRG